MNDMNKEILEKLKRIYDQEDTFGRKLMEREFPELAENNDERIRKGLIEYFQYCESSGSETANTIDISDILFWLEKQGEQNPTWSEDDEKMFDSIIEDVRPYGECPDYPTYEEREYFYEGGRKVEWLKSLKERIKK